MGHAEDIRLEELGRVRAFGSPELQTRADGNPLAPGRKQYRVWLGDREAAYLSFDVFWPNQINLYEVFVASEIRNRGVGSACIRFAIGLTKELAKPRLTVLPTPLSDMSENDLIAWYLRRGFTRVADEPKLLEIVLS
jgi:GNAT superfamily N-acetyltransferase